MTTLTSKNELKKSVCEKLIALNETIENAKKEMDALKTQLFNDMKSNNINKLENEKVLINFINETFRNDIDKKTLQEKYKKVYNEVLKITSVKEHLSIKVK